MIDMYKMAFNFCLILIAIPYVIANGIIDLLTGITVYILDNAGELISDNFKVVGSYSDKTKLLELNEE